MELSFSKGVARKEITDALKVVLSGQFHTRVKAVVHYDDGAKVVKTLFLRRYDSIGELAPGRRRYGYEFPQYGEINITKIHLQLPEKMTAGERYVKNLRRRKAYVAKWCPADVWVDFRAELDMDESKLAELAKFDGEGFGAWTRAQELGLPAVEQGYKTTTCKSAGATDGIRKRIQEAFDARQEFRVSWRDKYDCTASGNRGPDGVYRAFLSLEYKDCGNGHYYILLDGEHALFIEDD